MCYGSGAAEEEAEEKMQQWKATYRLRRSGECNKIRAAKRCPTKHVWTKGATLKPLQKRKKRSDWAREARRSANRARGRVVHAEGACV